jgi:hypothetical protein
MPKGVIPARLTEDDLVKLGGAEKAYANFFAQHWDNQLKFLHDGRKHVTTIYQQKPQPAPDHPGEYTLAVHVSHWLADPGDAKIGEIVYERSLFSNQEADVTTQMPRMGM